MRHMGTLVKEDENYWYIRSSREDTTNRFPKPKRVQELIKRIEEFGMLGALEPETLKRVLALQHDPKD